MSLSVQPCDQIRGLSGVEFQVTRFHVLDADEFLMISKAAYFLLVGQQCFNRTVVWL